MSRLISLAIILGISWGFDTSLTAQSQTVQVPISAPAPLFILPTYDGKVIKSSTLRGNVVLLDFFQTWCPDCQKSVPSMEKLYRKYKNQGFVVVGISHDQQREKVVEPFVKKYELTYPVCLGDLSIAINYIGITPEHPSFRIPYLVFIDRKGMIVGRYEEGLNPVATNPELVEKEVQRLIKETP
jgi:cytochrome c biogenesis protein CcmG/thiol:disulfide interchange protein DsbE